MGEALPTQIGRFRIVDEVGRGGFGRVYRAFDPSVGRPVAIKVLTDRTRDVFTRFRNEATVAGNLHHENIVTVYEYGEFEGQPYLAMEYLEGEDLQHIVNSLPKKPLTLLEKCRIMWQVAEGLACAHRNGVVHRDVKPGNIMVQRDGIVKIMDFGISRVTRDVEATRLTEQGFVLGTLRYMAPEQFAGAEFDPLCDIFAYGVIYHELLAGRHPFEAPDPRALMYRISFEEAPPIRDYASDCPEALQTVVSKLLHKDRELRYHNLKDVQFDVEPVYQQLQRQRGSALVGEAHELEGKGLLDQALVVLRDALTLDPSNAEGRSLKDSLQKQLQQRTIQPRIETLLNAAEEHLGQRRFGEAVQSLEGALRLDRDNAYILSRLEHARAQQEQSRLAGSLVTEARQEFHSQDLTAAYRSVSEALLRDPQNGDAADLLRTVQTAIDRRQREQRIEDAVRSAEGMLLIGSYEEAEGILTALQEDADPRVGKLLDLIQKEQEEQERRQQLQRAMAEVTDLLRSRRLAEAATRLEALKAEFPESREIANLLAFAQREMESESRVKAVEQIAANVAGLVQDKHFDAALAAIEQGTKKFPGENALIRLLTNTMAVKAAWDRQQAIEATVRKTEELRSGGRFAEAIEMVEATLREYSSEPALVPLLEQLEKDWAEQRRAEAVRKAANQARKLLAEGRPGEALQFLRQTSVQHPGDKDIAGLLEKAREEVRALEKAQAIQSIRKDAATRVEARDFAGALAAIEQGIRAWGEDPGLLRHRGEIETAAAGWEKQRDISAAVQRSRQLAERKQYGDARQLIEAALRRYPGDPELANAQAQIARETEEQDRKDAVRAIASEVRLLLSRDRLDAALETLREALQKYPGEPDLAAVEKLVREAEEALQRKQAIERMVRQSEELAAERKYDQARQVLELGLTTYPKDRVLAGKLSAVKADDEAWQRELAVQGVIGEARALAKEGRYDTALLLLLSSPVYSPSLLEAQSELEKERDQHERREAIAKAAAGVNTMLERGRAEEAIKVLRELSKQYPEAPQWESMKARAETLLEARRREEERIRALKEVQRSAEAMAGQSRHEAALELLDQSLKEFPDEAALLTLKEQIRAGLESRRRAESVASAVQAARGLLEQERYEDAVRSLREVCASHPGESGLKELLAQAEEKRDAREKRNRALAEAGGLLKEGRFEEVTNLLGPFAGRDRGDSELNALLSRAGTELEQKRRDAAVAKVAEEAEAVAKGRDFERALAVLDQGLQKWPGEGRLAAARDSIREAQSVWQREQARATAVGVLRKLVRDGRIKDGLERANSLLRDYPGDAELIALQRELQLRGILSRAGALLEKGEVAGAAKTLEDARPEFGTEPEWAALMERVNAARLTRARAAAIERKLHEARAKSHAGDLDGALAQLNEALKNWPGEKALLEARDAVLAAKTLRGRQDAIRAAVSECERMVRDNRLPAALQSIEKFLHDFPEEPEFVRLRERIQADLEAQEMRRGRERDLKELQEIEESALGGSRGQIAKAIDRARSIVSQHAADEAIAAAGARLLRYLQDLQGAAKELENGNFAAALEICGRWLAERPDHPKFKEIAAVAQRRQKAAYVADLQRRAGAENDLTARTRLFREGAERYPDERWITAELALTQNRLSLMETAIQKARAFEAAGQWDEALEAWNTLATIHSSQPGLDAEIRRVQAAREQARGDLVARWKQLIEDQLRAGELGRARELLRQAVAELPEAPALRELGRKIEEQRQKGKQARESLARAQTARNAGDCDECRARLREAYRLGEHDPALRKLVLSRLVEYAEAVLETNWRGAEALTAEAAALDSSFVVPGELLRTIAERKQNSLIDESERRVEILLQAGDTRGALAEVETALREAPGNPRLVRLRKELSARALRALGEIRQACERAAAAAELDPLQQRVAAVSAAAGEDTEVAAAAAETSRAIAARRRQLVRMRLLAQLAARKTWIGIGAAAAVAAAGALVVPQWVGPARPVTVTVTSDVAGALVAAGGAQCTTPQCTLSLRPGSYTLTAAKDGFASLSQPLVLSAKDRETRVPLVLQPLPEELQVNTNFESGSVSVDGRARGALRDGQFTLSGVAPGKHSIHVTGSDSEFAAEWQSAPGAAPQLLAPVTSKNLQAAVVANAGRTGTVACNCAPGDVSLDGAPAGRTGEGVPAKLPPLEPGSRKIAVGGRAVMVEIRPNPALNIFLSLDRNVGTLIINTGEDNVRVYLNNRAYPRLTERGALRIPVDVGDYTVRAEKTGFRNPPAQTVQLAKGEEKQITFAFTPVPPVLEITGALPHVRVEIDGREVGDTGGNGAFRGEVTPGRHHIGLSKDGYVPVSFDEQFTAGRGPVRPTSAQVAMSKVPAVQPPHPVTPVVDTEPQDWARASNSGRLQDLQEYLQKHGGGAHAREAQDQIDRLRQQSQQAEAARIEQAAWENLEKDNKAALLEFLSRHPNNPHLQEARNLLDGIQKRETAEAAAKKTEADNAAARAADIAAVQRTIGDYEAAFNRKDLATMRLLYDPLPARLVAQFSDARSLKSVSFELKPVEPPVIAQNSATVACTRSQRIVDTRAGPYASPTERVRVTLARTGSRWVIRDIK